MTRVHIRKKDQLNALCGNAVVLTKPAQEDAALCLCCAMEAYPQLRPLGFVSTMTPYQRMKTLVQAGAVALLLAFACPAQAFEDWSRKDTAWEVTFAVLLAADLATTDYGLRHGLGHEDNPVVGPYPSRGRLWGLGVCTALGHLGVATLLPPRWRTWWQAAGVSIEVVMVGNNTHVLLGGTF